MMLSTAGRHVAAAVLLRQILDEMPEAQPVRLELAKVLARMGDESGARRTLRELQAGRLPAEVARFVDQYSAALRARKPFGATFEVALAPDSNINRATRSDTLGTLVGDFILDEDAKQKSGVGVAFRGQAAARLRLSDSVNLLARSSTSANVYRDAEFNDVAAGMAAGPEFHLGSNRLSAEVDRSWRWFGGKLWLRSTTAGLSLLRPLDGRSQLRLRGSLGKVDHQLNRLQSGRAYSASVTYERALSPTTGIGASLAVDRQVARDPGYATRSVQLAAFAYRDLGSLTLFGSLSGSRLVADERLFLFPEKRRDRHLQASVGATFRRLAVGGFAPLLRLTHETNESSVEVFDYRRTRTEVGIARAF
jgi:hypothetical protein